MRFYFAAIATIVLVSATYVAGLPAAEIAKARQHVPSCPHSIPYVYYVIVILHETNHLNSLVWQAMLCNGCLLIKLEVH